MNFQDMEDVTGATRRLRWRLFLSRYYYVPVVATALQNEMI